jgi:hypothetical protein
MAADTVKPFVAPAPVAVLPATLGPQAWVDVAGGSLTGNGLGIGTATIARVSGAANIPLHGGPFNIELEGNAGMITEGGTSVGLDYGMVHAYWRNHTFALGGFGGIETIASERVDTFGGEAQIYHNKFSLYGQVAGFNIPSAGNGWWARGGVQLFLTDNFMLEGDVRDLGINTGGSGNLWLYAATVEFRPMTWPASFFATYRAVTESGENLNSWLVGVRFHVGNQTLHQQYTTGASMNVFPIEIEY